MKKTNGIEQHHEIISVILLILFFLFTALAMIFILWLIFGEKSDDSLWNTDYALQYEYADEQNNEKTPPYKPSSEFDYIEYLPVINLPTLPTLTPDNNITSASKTHSVMPVWKSSELYASKEISPFEYQGIYVSASDSCDDYNKVGNEWSIQHYASFNGVDYVKVPSEGAWYSISGPVTLYIKTVIVEDDKYPDSSENVYSYDFDTDSSRTLSGTSWSITQHTVVRENNGAYVGRTCTWDTEWSIQYEYKYSDAPKVELPPDDGEVLWYQSGYEWPCKIIIGNDNNEASMIAFFDTDTDSCIQTIVMEPRQVSTYYLPTGVFEIHVANGIDCTGTEPVFADDTVCFSIIPLFETKTIDDYYTLLHLYIGSTHYEMSDAATREIEKEAFFSR